VAHTVRMYRESGIFNRFYGILLRILHRGGIEALNLPHVVPVMMFLVDFFAIGIVGHFS
jgi:hypothetical protein